MKAWIIETFRATTPNLAYIIFFYYAQIKFVLESGHTPYRLRKTINRIASVDVMLDRSFFVNTIIMFVQMISEFGSNRIVFIEVI